MHTFATHSSPIVFLNALRYYRLRHEPRKLSFTCLAEVLVHDPDHLSRIERGFVVPSALMLHDLAAVLDVPVDVLYDLDWSRRRRLQIHARMADLGVARVKDCTCPICTQPGIHRH